MLWPRSGRCRTSCRSRPPASGTWVRPSNPPGVRNDRRPFRQPARAEPTLRRKTGVGRKGSRHGGKGPAVPVPKELVLLSEENCRIGRRVSKKSVLLDGGPRVRISFPPAASLSRECLPCLQAQRPGFRPECEPGRDQRTGRVGHEPARLGCFSLTGIDVVPPREIKALNEKSPGLGLDPLCRGSFFSSPGDDADRSSRAADRVR